VRSTYLVVVTIVLLLLAAALVLAERYQVDQAAGIPTRLDRFTGQVIACVPQRGCVEFIPAGQPVLAKVSAPPAKSVSAPPAPAPAAPARAAPPAK
jgi:hypothetical protein